MIYFTILSRNPLHDTISENKNVQFSKLSLLCFNNAYAQHAGQLIVLTILSYYNRN